MARIRTIKPEFFTSEDICSMSPLARLFYQACWCEADRDGRLEWRPTTMRIRYFPTDECDINAIAAEVLSRELVQVYEVEGRKYALIPTFSRHQHINPREAVSKIPAPSAEGKSVDAEPEPDASARVNDASARVGHAQVGKEGKGKEGIDTDSSLRSESASNAHATENQAAYEPPTKLSQPQTPLREFGFMPSDAPKAPPNPQQTAKKQPNTTPQKAAGAHRNPCRTSPPGAWYPLCDSREIDNKTGITHGVVGGYYLDVIADEVCCAAQMRLDWGGDWSPLIAWLRDGIDPNEVIAPAIREIAKRPGYRAPASLRYFDSAVRDAHARHPKPFWRVA